LPISRPLSRFTPAEGVVLKLLSPGEKAARLIPLLLGLVTLIVFWRLKKGLDHLQAVRKKFQVMTDRFAGCQAQWLNVHVDFPLLQRIALPSPSAQFAIPASKSTTPGSSAKSVVVYFWTATNRRSRGALWSVIAPPSTVQLA
jgi:hypothetical protein